jgi:hypothetical protein
MMPASLRETGIETQGRFEMPQCIPVVSAVGQAKPQVGVNRWIVGVQGQTREKMSYRLARLATIGQANGQIVVDFRVIGLDSEPS